MRWTTGAAIASFLCALLASTAYGEMLPADVASLDARAIKAIRSAGVYAFEDVVCIGNEPCTSIMSGHQSYTPQGALGHLVVEQDGVCEETFVVSGWAYNRSCGSSQWQKLRDGNPEPAYEGVSDIMGFAYNRCSPHPSAVSLEEMVHHDGRRQAVVHVAYPVEVEKESQGTFGSEQVRSAVLVYDADTALPVSAEIHLSANVTIPWAQPQVTFATVTRRTFHFGGVAMPTLPAEALNAPERHAPSATP